MRHLAAVQMELFLNGLDDYPWTGPELAEVERETLEADVPRAIGKSGHSPAPWFLV